MGWWGGGWGDRTPQCAVDVAEAFYAGKTRKRSSCKTDGGSYWFTSKGCEVEIARRLHTPEQIAESVEQAIAGGKYIRSLEFNMRGWRTSTTARHFNALGLKAESRGRQSVRFSINGHYVLGDWSNKWFTKEDILGWPTEHPDDAAARELAEQREAARKYRQGRKFVQLTPDMFA
jgi:hypothetical protein